MNPRRVLTPSRSLSVRLLAVAVHDDCETLAQRHFAISHDSYLAFDLGQTGLFGAAEPERQR